MPGALTQLKAAFVARSEECADRHEANAFVLSSAENRIQDRDHPRRVGDTVVKDDDHPRRKILGDEPLDVGGRSPRTVVGIGRPEDDPIAVLLRKPPL